MVRNWFVHIYLRYFLDAMLLYMYVMNRVILLTRFCKLLTTVAILSGEARASSASVALRLWSAVGLAASGKLDGTIAA